MGPNEMPVRRVRGWTLVKKIGSGSFGEIYQASSCGGGGERSDDVAIKLEALKTRHPQLDYEAQVLSALRGNTGVPTVYWWGTEGAYTAMVIDLLGPSLEDLFNRCGRRFTLKTVLGLARQLINRLEMVHGMSYVHRDVKPDNFLIGRGSRARIVHVIDFGLAKKYRDPHSHQHIPYREDKNLTGTARYASVSTHLGIEPSRRDDLESLGYVLVYLLRGSLPWQGLKADTKAKKYECVLLKKMETAFSDLCYGFPPEFCRYFDCVRNLRFDQKPDYDALRALFRDVQRRESYDADDDTFDWHFLPDKPIPWVAVPPDEPKTNNNAFSQREDHLADPPADPPRRSPRKRETVTRYVDAPNTNATTKRTKLYKSPAA
ncbi:hypothetical protein CTAYLR_008862 [Chrysophaeum taylorii]|uniref:Casein kinase I n=1 Tax=Chrysophaeum taylorii TaxID=2483200 RepID=A0AAD7XUD9_9STRA|nr:hypothetical protein CTAYLR_008862 [Chrysophaeum taylorii]